MKCQCTMVAAALVSVGCGNNQDRVRARASTTDDLAKRASAAISDPSATARPRPIPSDERARALYAIGMRVGEAWIADDPREDDLPAIVEGMQAALAGQIDRRVVASGTPIATQMARDSAATRRGVAEAANRELASEVQAQKGAVTLPSGIIKVARTGGKGASPSTTDNVRLRFTGRLADGRIAIQSGSEGDVFPMSGMIPCWRDSLSTMKPGGAAQIYCPPESAYGEAGLAPTVPPHAGVVFDLDLLGLQSQPMPPEPMVPGLRPSLGAPPHISPAPPAPPQI